MGTMQLCSYTGQDTDSVTPAACDIISLSFSSEDYSLFRHIKVTMDI